jgi:3-oxoacyl-[acyl-carrier protein] reductase
VNSAGNSPYAEFLTITDDQAVGAWTLKTMTAVRLTRLLAPIMEARGGGAIVNMGGGSGREPTATSLPASLANAGMRVFTKSGAAELARRGIAINSISPGYVHTDRHVNRARAAAQQRGISIEEVLREWAAVIPTGRTTSAEETAELILFLASRRVPNLVGAEIVLDGGEGRTV